MFQEVWNYICELFTTLFNFFVHKETSMDKPAVLILMFIVIGVTLIFALGRKSKGKSLASPLLFTIAILLTIFTVTY
ncbi:MAG: hypothetical protein IJA61_04255 [Clostridia bacterium]|nr:hypothetical protein [Clostridia bacterium]